MNRVAAVVIMCLILLAITSAISCAEIYHVSPAGTASWSACTSMDTPCSWQTAMANALADDVVYFHGGTYNVESSCSAWGDVAMTPAHSGFLGHYITFIAYPGETPVINGCAADPSAAAFGAINVDYIIWDGFSGKMVPHPSTSRLFVFWNSIGSIVRNCNFTGVQYEGIANNAPVDIQDSSDNEVYNNFFHDCTGTPGINMNTAGVWLIRAQNAKVHHNMFYNDINGVMQNDGPNLDTKIYRNFFRIAGGVGINLNEQYPSSGGLKIYENVLLNANQGIALDGTSDGLTVNNYQIFNNTMHGVKEGIGLSSYTRSTAIWNNIIVNNTGDFLRYYAGSSLPSYSDYNAFSGGGYWNLSWNFLYSLTSWTAQTSLDSGSVLADPGFLDPGGLNASDYKRSFYPTNGRGGLYASVMGAYITGNERIGHLPPPGRLRGLGTAAGAPAISIPPVGTSVLEGQTATFSVSASGDAPLAYQWKRNGTNVGTNSPSFTTDPTTISNDNGARFSVVVSNPEGQVASAEAILTVRSGIAPAITLQPASTSVSEGQTATFSVSASGDAPLSYQWKRNGSNVGANSPSFTAGPTTMDDNGAGFTVVVSNSVGQVESAEAVLTVSPVTGAPVITVQPVNRWVTEGQTATFSVTATGTAPLAYQWKRNGSNVGANSSTFTTGPTTISNDNGARFSVVVANPEGQVASAEGILRVLPDGTVGAVIDSYPVSGATDVSVNARTTATFSIEMDASTITSTSFIVKDSNDYSLNGTVSYGNSVATFTPSNSLQYNTAYTATITMTVKDILGNPLAADYSWSFTTINTPPINGARSAKSVLVIPGYWTKSNGDIALPDNPSDLLDPKVQANLRWDAEHYDAVAEMGRGFSSALAFYKTINPSLYATYYDELYQVISTDDRYASMVDWCVAHGVDIEEFFVHYSYDTDLLRFNTPLTIKGWDPTHTNPNATAMSQFEARVLDSNWEDQGGYVTWRLNVKNAHYRQWAAEYLNTTATTLGFNGEETDTMPYGGMLFDPDIHILTTGVSGTNSGNTIEYPITDPAGYPSSDARNALYEQDFVGLLQSLRDSAPGKTIGGNLSMYQNYWNFEQKSDHMRREDILDSVYHSTIPKALVTLGRFSAAGGKNFVQNLMLFYSYLPNTPATWDRDKLLGLATFYVVQNPQNDYYNSQATYYYGNMDLQSSNPFYSVFGGVPRNRAFYTSSIEVDIGQPAQSIPQGYEPIQLYWDPDLGGPGWDIYSNQSTMSNGVPVYPTYSYIYTNGPQVTLERDQQYGGGTTTVYAPVYARSYTKGLVLARANPSWDMAMNANNLGDAQALTVTLPKAYRPVYADGSLGPSTTTVTLRVLEGAILVDP